MNSDHQTISILSIKIHMRMQFWNIEEYKGSGTPQIWKPLAPNDSFSQEVMFPFNPTYLHHTTFIWTFVSSMGVWWREAPTPFSLNWEKKDLQKQKL